ncbi:helix-turn-helix domain-containing protein [Streptomyces chartreusis]|uniref:helix-turn-helix domain-containing protein n=1 Tax=Streptomyces chartreusis TaxID=1969 RepID=UPI003649D7F2
MPAPAVPPTLEYYLAASARSPIALCLVLGHLLRTLRKAAGIDAEAAGRSIRGSEAKISRMERAQVTCKRGCRRGSIMSSRAGVRCEGTASVVIFVLLE